jgi:serine/threonine protein kinase
MFRFSSTTNICAHAHAHAISYHAISKVKVQYEIEVLEVYAFAASCVRHTTTHTPTHTHTPVHAQGTDKKFAMKTLDKFEMQERNKVQRVLTEELILTSVDHPFLPTLYCTIQVGLQRESVCVSVFAWCVCICVLAQVWECVLLIHTLVRACACVHNCGCR